MEGKSIDNALAIASMIDNRAIMLRDRFGVNMDMNTLRPLPSVDKNSGICPVCETRLKLIDGRVTCHYNTTMEYKAGLYCEGSHEDPKKDVVK